MAYSNQIAFNRFWSVRDETRISNFANFESKCCMQQTMWNVLYLSETIQIDEMANRSALFCKQTETTNFSN